MSKRKASKRETNREIRQMLFPVEGEMALWQLMKKRWDSPFL